MDYYIKVEWNGSYMYYVGDNQFAVKQSPFYRPKRFSLVEANKMALRLKDRDRVHKYELEVAS